MRPDDLVDDGQAQTAAAVVAGPRFVESDEPLQHSVPFGFRNPGSVVGAVCDNQVRLPNVAPRLGRLVDQASITDRSALDIERTNDRPIGS